MRRPTALRICSLLLSAAVILAATGDGALAFCPMCRTAMEGAAGAREAADGLNLAALVLLAPPLTIFAALFGLFYRLRNASGQSASLDGEAEERAAPGALTQ